MKKYYQECCQTIIAEQIQLIRKTLQRFSSFPSPTALSPRSAATASGASIIFNSPLIKSRFAAFYVIRYGGGAGLSAVSAPSDV